MPSRQIPAFARHGEPAVYRRDLAARRLDARDRLVGVLDHGRHVMRVGVHDGVGVAHDGDVALPEDQVAAPQLLASPRHSAPGRGRPAACRCRAGSRCRRRSARPARGRSNRCRGCSCRPTDRACRRSVRRPRRNPSRIASSGADMAARQIASLRASRRTRRLRARPRRCAPIGSVSTGGSLIDGPGNANVRSAVTLCVGAAPGLASARIRQPADIAVAVQSGPRQSLRRCGRRS